METNRIQLSFSCTKPTRTLLVYKEHVHGCAVSSEYTCDALEQHLALNIVNLNLIAPYNGIMKQKH